MKTPRFLGLILAAFFALVTPRLAQARVEASFDFFYDSLEPYGEWVQIADYGYCWRPTDVDRDWAPYSDGYWAYTDAGWTWVSYEDYGGIVYHYGRWVRVEDEGWCWVPDYEWGPAWVSWRNNDDYVGWAPLPPEARWQPSVGISIWADRVYDIGPGHYNFCHVRDFGAPVLRPVIINRGENVTIIRRTVNITNISYNTSYYDGPIVCNGGPNYTFINQRSTRQIPALKLVQRDDWRERESRGGDGGDRRRDFNGRAEGNQLIVSAPRVKPPVDPDFLKPRTKKVIAANRVSRGWEAVKNEEVRRELKQEMQRQTRGLTPETAPARGITTADLRVVPNKADPRAPSLGTTKERREDLEKGGRTEKIAAQPQGRTGVEDGRSTGSSNETTAGSKARPTQKAAQENGRPERETTAGESAVKPFDPVSEANNPRNGKGAATPQERGSEPRTAKSNGDAGNMRGEARRAEIARPHEPEQLPSRQQTAQAEQEKAARKSSEASTREKQQRDAQRQAETSALRKQQVDAQRAAQTRQQMEAQRQAEGMRQQQKQREAAVARQRMQAEQERSTRQQSEAISAQQRQADSFRRQQQEAAAQQQQRRNAEQPRVPQRGEAPEQQFRRGQEVQREPQIRRQEMPQRQVREPQRPAAPASSGSENDRRGKKKED